MSVAFDATWHSEETDDNSSTFRCGLGHRGPVQLSVFQGLTFDGNVERSSARLMIGDAGLRNSVEIGDCTC